MEIKKETYNILYVDDEENNLNAFRAALRRDYNVFTALSGEEGMEILSKNDIHVVITDQRMPDMTGVQFLQRIPGDQDNCLLYTSDAADERSSVDLGGRRIIKKK